MTMKYLEDRKDQLQNYYKQTELYDMIDNKTVAFVGRSQYLLDDPEYENQGEYIDSHDIVIRVNSPNPYPYKIPYKMQRVTPQEMESPDYINPSLHQYVGKKTDILCLPQGLYEVFVQVFLDKFVASPGGQMVVEGNIQPHDAVFWHQYIPEITKKTKHHTPHNEVHRGVRKFAGQIHRHEKWTTGSVALTELLVLDNFKSLDIIGCTGYMLEKEMREMNMPAVGDFGLSTLACFEYALQNDKVSTGPTLQGVLARLSRGELDEYFDMVHQIKVEKYER